MSRDEPGVARLLPGYDLGDHHRHAGRHALMGRGAARLADHEMAREHELRDAVGPSQHFGPSCDGAPDRVLESGVTPHRHRQLQIERSQRGGQSDRVAPTGIEHEQHARAAARERGGTSGETRGHGESEGQHARGGHALPDHHVGGGPVRRNVPVGMRAVPGSVHRDRVGDHGDEPRARGVVTPPAAGHHVVVQRIGRDDGAGRGLVEQRVEPTFHRPHQRQGGADEGHAVEAGVQAAPEAREAVREPDVSVPLGAGALRTVGLDEEVVHAGLERAREMARQGLRHRPGGRIVPFAETGGEHGHPHHRTGAASAARTAGNSPAAAFARCAAIRVRSSSRPTTRRVPSVSSTTAVSDSTQSPELR